MIRLPRVGGLTNFSEDDIISRSISAEVFQENEFL